MESPDLPVFDDAFISARTFPLASLRERAVALDRRVRDLSSDLIQLSSDLGSMVPATGEAPRPDRPAGEAAPVPLGEDDEPWCVIRLLGPVVVACDNRPVDLSRRGKAESVLKALVLSRHRRATPGLLAEWIWPRLDDHDARHNLQTTVSAMRRSVQRRPGGHDLIRYAGDAYHLDREVVTDIDLFDRAYGGALAFERRGQDDLALDALVSALSLYRGDLDIDEFEDMQFLIERERLSAINLTILAKISAMHFRAGRWEESIAFARRLLARDPSREDAHRLIIRCYLRLGQRAQGMHQYELCVRIIGQYFDSAVEPETAALRSELFP